MGNDFDIRDTVSKVLTDKVEEEKLYLYSDHCHLFDEYPSLLRRKQKLLEEAYAFLCTKADSKLYGASEEEAEEIVASDIDKKVWTILEDVLASEEYKLIVSGTEYDILTLEGNL